MLPVTVTNDAGLVDMSHVLLIIGTILIFSSARLCYRVLCSHQPCVMNIHKNESVNLTSEHAYSYYFNTLPWSSIGIIYVSTLYICSVLNVPCYKHLLGNSTAFENTKVIV